jgi:hypothetical protein
MEADRRKRVAAEMHSRTTQGFLTSDQELMQLAKTRKKVILKTQPYFAAKDRHDKSLTGGVISVVVSLPSTEHEHRTVRSG